MTSLQGAWLDFEPWHATGLHGWWCRTACQRRVRERNLQQYVRTWRNRCAATANTGRQAAAAKRLPARRQREITQTAKSSENQACNSFHACGVMKGRQDSHWHTYTHCCPWAYCAACSPQSLPHLTDAQTLSNRHKAVATCSAAVRTSAAWPLQLRCRFVCPPSRPLPPGPAAVRRRQLVLTKLHCFADPAQQRVEAAAPSCCIDLPVLSTWSCHVCEYPAALGIIVAPEYQHAYLTRLTST